MRSYMQLKDVMAKSAQLLEQRCPFMIVTVIAFKGSIPQEIGAKALIDKNGLVIGTIGGGKIEAKSIELAREFLLHPNKTLWTEHWNLNRDLEMSCGGEITLLFERFQSLSPRVVIFGAGHVAQALIKILLHLDFEIICLDDRKNWLDKLPDQNDHPQLKKVLYSNLENEIERQAFTGHEFFLTLTQGHRSDLPILKILLTKLTPRPSFIGTLGSYSKSLRLKKELRSEGIVLLDGFYCPVGLPISNNTPEEISISIIGKILELKNKSNISID